MESKHNSEEKQGDGGYKSEKIQKARLISTLNALLEDPVLSDVPTNPSLSDVDTLIGLELGSAMHISVLKFDGTAFDVVLMNSATVKDLKLAIMKKVNDVEQSKMGHRHISWRHVWANYCLSYESEKLIDDPTKLQDFGIRNNSQVVPSFSNHLCEFPLSVRMEGFEHGVSFCKEEIVTAPVRFWMSWIPSPSFLLKPPSTCTGRSLGVIRNYGKAKIYSIW